MSRFRENNPSSNGGILPMQAEYLKPSFQYSIQLLFKIAYSLSVIRKLLILDSTEAKSGWPADMLYLMTLTFSIFSIHKHMLYESL